MKFTDGPNGYTGDSYIVDDGTDITVQVGIGTEGKFIVDRQAWFKNFVGIGVEDPSYELDVDGDINIATGNKYKIDGTNLSYSDVGALPTSAIPASFLGWLHDNGTGTRAWSTPTYSDVGAFPAIHGVSANYLVRATSTTEFRNSLIYDNGSIVGIGTDSSTVNMHLYKTTGGAEFRIETTYATGTARLSFKNLDTKDAEICFYGESDGAGSKGRINYSHATDAMQIFTNALVRVCINSSGSVGIGTTDPLNNGLQIGSVGATGYANNNLAIGDGSRAFAINVDSNGANFRSSTSKFIFESGNVGIGTTNPTKIIEINGTTNTEILINRTGANAASVGLGCYNKGYLYARTGYKLGLGSNGDADVITLDTAGSVGIGITNPQTKFHSYSGSAGSSVIAWNTTLQHDRNVAGTGTGIGIVLKLAGYQNATEQKKWAGIAAVSSGDWNEYIDLVFYTHSGSGNAPTEKMRLSSAGYLGIGTNSPDAQLTLYKQAPEIKFKDSSTSGVSTIIYNPGVGSFRLDTDLALVLSGTNGITLQSATTCSGTFDCYGTATFYSIINLSVSEYANNAAAITGGLESGDVYRTGDTLKIVH
ncbi:MAG: hypothetical protein PHN88_14810 [Ignavibacteria bacterium]|nr:hypothetical protein [Ignavibacteria bacterium]